MTENLLGEERLNNKGTAMKIIAVRKKSDIDVQFLDEHGYIKEHTTYVNFKRGQIKNPYDKTACGIGYIGDGNYMAKVNGKQVPEYHIWTMMIRRCYDIVEGKRFPAYYGTCTVCNEWHNYQNFAKWYHDNMYEVEGRLHLDKDILIPGNKEYHPDKCLLVPQRINMLFVNKPNKNGLPNGIMLADSKRYCAEYGGKYLGTYDTIEEAFENYAVEKERVIKEIADEYKEIIPTILYDALCRYKVDICNDKNWN